MGDTTNTMLALLRRAQAICSAAIEFDVDKVVAMAGAVGWTWGGDRRTITRDMVKDHISKLCCMLLSHEGEAESDWTGGFSYSIKHYPQNADGPDEWICKIRWGESSEGSASDEE